MRTNGLARYFAAGSCQGALPLGPRGDGPRGCGYDRGFLGHAPCFRAACENGTHRVYHHGHRAGSGKRQAYAFTALHLGRVHGP